MSEPIHVVCPHCDAVNRVPGDKLGSGAKCGKCRSPLFQGTPLALDEHRFNTHVQRSDLPVLVEFWAPWCAPCRMMAPAFEQAAAQLEPRARLVKVNTEEAQGLALQFGIRSIPTLVLYKGGREAARAAGAMDAHRLIAWTQQHL